MAKTTVELPEVLHRTLRVKAAVENRSMNDIADKQLSMRTACSADSAPKRNVTASTRVIVGHWQNRSASALVCTRNSHSTGLAVPRVACEG